MSDKSIRPVSVEIERSFNPVTKVWQHQVAIKLDAGALANGVLSQMSDREWKNLCLSAVEKAIQGPPLRG
ncbi:hypothetical protein BXT84_00440 [Sulfobacillus thermotolerans]|uniref:Uncharacterized protein n=1 Tax=Sulfobacillus thermotolerans TaxID=338644 RepID=A0ABM6RMR8_9FIRM|nr:hypothetical protein BXT84_00440 [Sulfobacillus thermotolerans]